MLLLARRPIRHSCDASARMFACRPPPSHRTTPRRHAGICFSVSSADCAAGMPPAAQPLDHGIAVIAAGPGWPSGHGPGKYWSNTCRTPSSPPAETRRVLLKSARRSMTLRPITGPVSVFFTSTDSPTRDRSAGAAGRTIKRGCTGTVECWSDCSGAAWCPRTAIRPIEEASLSRRQDRPQHD